MNLTNKYILLITYIYIKNNDISWIITEWKIREKNSQDYNQVLYKLIELKLRNWIKKVLK